MLAAWLKVPWQQRAPGHVPGSTFPGQAIGVWATFLLSFDEVHWGCIAGCMRSGGQGCQGNFSPSFGTGD